jgi:rhamnosyltransferase
VRVPAVSSAPPPRVLVLLAAYNGARWIVEQLASILAQQAVQVHVVARDDGSTDETSARLATAACDPRVIVSAPGPPSGSAAQNFFSLIRQSSADEFDFVAFSDQDDVWHPQKLSRAVTALNESTCAGYSCATTAVWPDGKAVVLRQSPNPTRADFLFEGAGQGCTFVLSAALYRRFRELVLREPDLTAALHYHDWSVYAAGRSWGLRWHFDPQSFVTYRQHAANDTGARSTYAGLSKRLGLIRRGWYREQLFAIANLCAKAAPCNPVVVEWWRLLGLRNGASRRLQIARFCLRGSRRRRGDSALLLIAALAGWI